MLLSPLWLLASVEQSARAAATRRLSNGNNYRRSRRRTLHDLDYPSGPRDGHSPAALGGGGGAGLLNVGGEYTRPVAAYHWIWSWADGDTRLRSGFAPIS